MYIGRCVLYWVFYFYGVGVCGDGVGIGVDVVDVGWDCVVVVVCCCDGGVDLVDVLGVVDCVGVV